MKCITSKKSSDHNLLQICTSIHLSLTPKKFKFKKRAKTPLKIKEFKFPGNTHTYTSCPMYKYLVSLNSMQ